MFGKPRRSCLCHLFQRSRFFKKVGCSRDENQLFVLALQSPQCLAVQTDDLFVERAHEEQNGRVNLSQGFGRQVRPTSARDNSRNQIRKLRCSCQGSRGACAGPKIANGETFG